ncbi:hypothetical protein DR740_07600 [Campylobacter lari]|nr:hypothetical protein [Campylobacter lari]
MLNSKYISSKLFNIKPIFTYYNTPLFFLYSFFILSLFFLYSFFILSLFFLPPLKQIPHISNLFNKTLSFYCYNFISFSNERVLKS